MEAHRSPAEAIDYDLHGIVGVRLLGATAREVAAVDDQLGPIRSPLQRPPDLVIRFVDRLQPAGTVRLLGLDEAAFTDDAFLVLRGKQKSRARVQIPMARIGERCEIVCERGVLAVPLLIPILNLTALARGALPLHAAALQYEGKGILVTGWSKGGKTETLLAFMDRGARYIGDEWVYIDSQGETMHGVPEPVRVWDWHLQQMPQYRRALSAATRGRLRLLSTLLALEGRMSSTWGRRLPPLRLLQRARPLLQRQAGVNVHPRTLFGDCLDLSGRLDRVVFVGSHEEPDVSVRPMDPREVAARMVHSLQYERLPFMAFYETFRFAFPEARNEWIESAEALQRQRLQQVLSEKPCFEVLHPYPPSIPSLFDHIEPLL